MPCFEAIVRGSNTQKVDLVDSVLDSTDGEEALSIQPFVDEGLGKSSHFSENSKSARKKHRHRVPVGTSDVFVR